MKCPKLTNLTLFSGQLSPLIILHLKNCKISSTAIRTLQSHQFLSPRFLRMNGQTKGNPTKYNLIHVHFDIQSLFTNTALDETIGLICNTVLQSTDRFHNFPKTEFWVSLYLAAKNSSFQQRKLYLHRRVQYGLIGRSNIFTRLS